MGNFVSNSDANALMSEIGKKKLTVTDVMPLAASAANEGIPYLYLGATTQDFTNGSIYESQEVTPATDPKTYEWVEKYQSSVDLTYYKRIWGGTEAEWELLTDEQKAQYEYTFFDGDSNDYFAVVDAVTDGDMHPVTSNAVAEEVEDLDAEIADIVNIYGAKNFIPSGYLTSEQNFGGVTFTPNNDGTYTLNGTCTSFYDVRITPWGTDQYDNLIQLPLGEYELTGCPTNGEGNYSLYVLWNNGTSRDNLGPDNGEGFRFTHSDAARRYEIKITIFAGASFNNVVFKPMLRPASIKDDTYVPYAATNKQLTANKMSYADNGILGAKNLWDISSVHPTGGNGGGSASYSNGVITVNCPAVLNSGAYITGSQLRSKFANLNGLPIIISFDVKGDSSFNATVGPEVGGTAEAVSLSTSYLHKEYLFNGAEDIKTLIFYTQDASQTHTITVTNFMLRLATDNDSTYQSYTKTNKELTDCLTSGDFAPIFGYIYGTKATIAGTADEALVIKETENEDFKDIVIRDASDTTRYKLHFSGGDVTVTTYNSSGTIIRSTSLSRINQNYATVSEYLYANTLAIYKCGRMVWVTGYVPQANYSANQLTTIATIDSTKYPLPELTIRTIASYASQAYDPPEGIGYLNIANNGTISFKPSTNLTSKSLYFSVCYIGKDLV